MAIHTQDIWWLASDPQPPQLLALGRILHFMVLRPFSFHTNSQSGISKQLFQSYSAHSSQSEDPSLLSIWLRPTVPPVADPQAPVSPVSGPILMLLPLLACRPLMLLTSHSGWKFASPAHREHRIHLHFRKLSDAVWSPAASPEGHALLQHLFQNLQDLPCDSLRYCKYQNGIRYTCVGN